MPEQIFSEELEVSYSLFVRDDTLILSTITFGDEPLRQVACDMFIEAESGPVPDLYKFVRSAEGRIEALLIGNNDARNQRFDLMDR